jgi:hypothetical protein
MAADTYSMGAFGGVAAPKRSKEALLGDLKRIQTNPQEAGLTLAEREGLTDEAKQAASAQAGTIATDIAQAGLGGTGWTGQLAESARQVGKNVSEAVAGASSDAYKYSNEVARQFARDTRARLEAQQERARQNAQFWAQKGIDIGQAVASAVIPG